MRIAIADNNSRKFTDDLISHWEKKHEVRYEPGASEFLAQWADFYYVDTWANNIHYLYKLYHGLHDDMPDDWDNEKKPKIAVRALDWEVWVGKARDQKIIDWVDTAICIAPHIEKQLREHGDFGGKLHVIRPGVNLDKFTLKKDNSGYQIGMVLGDMWWPKNHMAGLDIFNTFLKFGIDAHLHIRGQHEGGTEFWTKMYEHYLKSRGIEDKVTLYPHQEDMNEWYEKIDVLLHPGMKEAFCYAVAEAMAKGIKPIVNEFYGSKDIWPDWALYQTHQEAVGMIVREKKKPSFYRNWIKDKYPLDKMLKKYDELLGT